MQNEEGKSRRHFLKGLGAILSCQYFLDDAAFGANTKKAPARNLPSKNAGAGANSAARAKNAVSTYKIGPWTGDDFTIGHRLRIGDLPKFPEKAEKTVDFIIVGGGVAGLSAAYKLKDHDFLLLEQYSELGGQSRGSSYHGIDYSYGAAYIGEVEDEYGALWSELGISPVPLPPERNAFLWGNQWMVGVEGDNTKPIYKEFKRFMAEAKPIWDKLPDEMEPEKLAAADLLKLDNVLMSTCMKGYSPQFMSLMDSFLKSSLNAGVNQISALGAYGLMLDLVSTTHVFKGGNPAIARALASKIDLSGSNRVIKKCFVWKVEVKEGGASVVYSTGDGASHRVDCKHVIMATSPLVASRQLVHIPDEIKASLMSFRFGSYMVANICMKQKLFNGPYDCFAGAPYTFSDITVAETPYMKTDTYKPSMGSVLTVYHPYEAGTAGRTTLFVGDKQKLAASVVSQLDKITPGLEKAVEEVVLTRWGHALAIIGPGYFSRLGKLQSLPETASYSLAHSSVWGWPAAESAIRGGGIAAARALKSSAGISVIKD